MPCYYAAFAGQLAAWQHLVNSLVMILSTCTCQAPKMQVTDALHALTHTGCTTVGWHDSSHDEWHAPTADAPEPAAADAAKQGGNAPGTP